ncbi:MICAL-like protein 1 isoform X2 [Betta splendens]|uniref:MICAL-like protein 1 isoform X2 n=1 Tax=Betta splendens TaxID=158456 RepID=A0A6P7N7P2_BETSP|nr:MICAL-like protein 1 isoform X2 [Betta splendens]
MASPWALQEWCRVTCADYYPSVEIKNMSSSFRDGLAFCAIIHKHRPDLIDFSSLSRTNAHQNNSLAFQVAETQLGIPALLDPRDLGSCTVPDSLSIISYVFQYFWFFSSRTNGPASLRSLHTELNYSKTKSPDGPRSLKSSAHLKSSEDAPTVCLLCLQPVHLIQRLLVDGGIYHRSCFRCRVCHCTLLPDLYTRGSDAGALICVHHTKKSKSVCAEFRQQIGSARDEFQTNYVSLSGLAVTSVPHYTMNTEPQDKLVHRTAKTEMKDSQERIREENDGESCSAALRISVTTAAPRGEGAERGGADVGAGSLRQEVAQAEQTEQTVQTQRTQQPAEPGAQVTGGGRRPVPAPRRTSHSPAPVPAPRVKAPQTSCRPAAGNTSSQCKPPISPPSAVPTGVNPKVKTSHPWLGIIHPGPWTQLPPAPPPLAPPRSRSLFNLQEPWYRPRVPPPNPFGEEVEEAAEQTTEDAVCSGDAEKSHSEPDSKAEPPDKPIPPKRRERARAEAAVTCSEAAGGSGGSQRDETQDTLPRSVSVPTITCAFSQSSSEPRDTRESDSSKQSEQMCKDKLLDVKPAMPRSKTFQALSSHRAAAPGHGFPLVRRKVQTDQSVPTGDLQAEMGALNKQLEALEQRGVELEKNLRDKSCSQSEEEQMLLEWFSLIHKRHVLVCRDTELVYLRKQQNLEEEQADVEYDLRCLLNKPESDWSPEDRIREQQLMDELVGIIEQRNQIISSLDQDRQRERKDDELWETMMKSKELQNEGLKQIKKSKGKSKPPNVFKMLSHKAVSIKNNVDKKS